MIIRCRLTDVQPDSYPSKGKEVKTWRYLLQDNSDGPRCKTPLEMQEPREDGQTLTLKRDELVDVTVTEIGEPFGGAVRIRGNIKAVNGANKPG